MKLAKFQYKCRRCGKIECNPSTDSSCAENYLVRTMYGWESPKDTVGFFLKMFAVHDCQDGGKGVADLIGYEVDK